MAGSEFQSNQMSDVEVVISSLNRLIDGITPALTNLTSIPVVLDTIDKRLDTLHNDLINLKQCIEKNMLDIEYVEDVISEVEKLRDNLNQYIAVFEEFNKVQQDKVEYDKTIAKVKWEVYSKIAFYVLGSGGILALLFKVLLGILGVNVTG